MHLPLRSSNYQLRADTVCSVPLLLLPTLGYLEANRKYLLVSISVYISKRKGFFINIFPQSIIFVMFSILMG